MDGSMCAPPAGELPAGRCIPGAKGCSRGPGLPPSGVRAPGEEAATQDVPEEGECGRSRTCTG